MSNKREEQKKEVRAFLEIFNGKAQRLPQYKKNLLGPLVTEKYLADFIEETLSELAKE